MLYYIVYSMKIKMEYSLLKTIESGFGSPFIPNSYPTLTAYPSRDYVNPGLGQISRLYSFYVPLHSDYNLHTLKKKVDLKSSENLEGSGISTENDDLTQTSEHVDEETSYNDPQQYNEIKRKRMGSPIQDAFLHPKVIKTDKIIFASSSKQPPKQPKETKTLPKISNNTKYPKHKFQFFFK